MVEDQTGPTDRIVIKLDPGQPIELTNLSDSFAALARLYERHYRAQGEGAPKLYITRLETGSIIAEIAPYIVMLGAIVTTMDHSVIVADFTNRLWRGIKAFASPPIVPLVPEIPSRDDAADIREFVRPLTGKQGATLGIKHARLESNDGERSIVVEYKFDETEINRAALNIDAALSATHGEPKLAVLEGVAGPIKTEVMLFFEQASRKPGKESGRTGDRAIVPDVSQKALPVHFRDSFQDLKERMVRGDINPLKSAFVVDVLVQYVGGEPKGYIVTDVHKVIPSEDGD